MKFNHANSYDLSDDDEMPLEDQLSLTAAQNPLLTTAEIVVLTKSMVIPTESGIYREKRKPVPG